MIQIDRETFQMMLHQIMERFDKIEDRLNRMNRQTSALDGDKLLDNQDMCELLGITKRTLARYRQKKLVAYYMIDGRTYYKSSEVEAFLNQKGKRMPDKTEKPGGIIKLKEYGTCMYSTNRLLKSCVLRFMSNLRNG